MIAEAIIVGVVFFSCIGLIAVDMATSGDE